MFSDLPTEMKANVFAYIRKRSYQAAVCLVSREWKDFMAPMLWEELELEPETSPRRLATILKLRNGITPHIRRIFVLYSYVGMGSQCPPAFETVIQLLIGALPGNHLRTFVSQVVTSTPLLLHLFQRQSILDEFDIRTIDFTNAGAIDFRKPTHTSWVLPSLTSIKTLAMSLNRDDVESYRTSGFFIRNASKLKELHLRGMGSGRTIAPLVHPSGLNVFDRLGANDGHPQLNISRLTLETMGLGPPGLTEYIDCGQLTSLQVIRCSNSMQLMMALAPEFKRACTLSELRITVPRHHGPPEETTQAVETLLQSFSGLEKLWLDLAGGRMVNVACIAGHGSSLKLIGLGASPRAPVNYLSAADLATVLQSAPRLESLAINLCPVSLGNTKAVGAGFKLRAASEDPYAAIELETYLDIIAKHPTLQHLRVLKVLKIQYSDDREPPSHENGQGVKPHDDDVNVTRVIMEHFATQAMSFMCELGSNIKVFSISPTVALPSIRGVEEEWV